jgi:DTW domain-containing protein YfiP
MSRPQCSRCLRPTAHCLCPLIPSLDSRTRVLLLQHPSEVNHALNTARLAALGLNKRSWWWARSSKICRLY